MTWLQRSVIRSWYSPQGGWTRWLHPLSRLFTRIATQRRQRYSAAVSWQPPIPIVVVGNIAVGGTGKTPLVASLVQRLQQDGYKPAIISRGFGAERQQDVPLQVYADSDPALVGDEPVMLAQQLMSIPLLVDTNRLRAAQWICEHTDCNIIVADDGLQHYKLPRTAELVVFDGERLVGNGLCLPAGPLREPLSRIQEVDMVLVNSTANIDVNSVQSLLRHKNLYDFALVTAPLLRLDGMASPPPLGRVHGVAGIGNPKRFFNTLSQLGYEVIEHSFADHHSFVAKELQFDDDLPVIMTAKDAVKCRGFAQPNYWFLPVQVQLSDALWRTFILCVENRKDENNG